MKVLRLGRGSVRDLGGWAPSRTGGLEKASPPLWALLARPAPPSPIAELRELDPSATLALCEYRARLAKKLVAHAGVRVRRERIIDFDDGGIGWAMEIAVVAFASAGTTQMHVLREGRDRVHHLVATASAPHWPRFFDELMAMVKSYAPTVGWGSLVEPEAREATTLPG